MHVTIYHNPRCSKSRQTLEIIRSSGIEPEIIEYLKTPPDTGTFREILRMLGLKPRQIMRTKEKEYREKGLDDETLGDKELIAAMQADPILIERPIVVAGEKAVIGRPPENVLDIIK